MAIAGEAMEGGPRLGALTNYFAATAPLITMGIAYLIGGANGRTYLAGRTVTKPTFLVRARARSDGARIWIFSSEVSRRRLNVDLASWRTHMDRAKCKSPVPPTEEEIAEACAAIQRSWDPAERKRRAQSMSSDESTIRTKRWRPPTFRIGGNGTFENVER
jgi:hypothetical protein